MYQRSKHLQKHLDITAAQMISNKYILLDIDDIDFGAEKLVKLLCFFVFFFLDQVYETFRRSCRCQGGEVWKPRSLQ